MTHSTVLSSARGRARGHAPVHGAVALALAVVFSAAAAPAIAQSNTNTVTDLAAEQSIHFNQSVRIPGQTLSPGRYTLQVVRPEDTWPSPVRFVDATGNVVATVLTSQRDAKEGSTAGSAAETGSNPMDRMRGSFVVAREPGGQLALVAWFPPGSSAGHDFIYQAQAPSGGEQRTIEVARNGVLAWDAGAGTATGTGGAMDTTTPDSTLDTTIDATDDTPDDTQDGTRNGPSARGPAAGTTPPVDDPSYNANTMRSGSRTGRYGTGSSAAAPQQSARANQGWSSGSTGYVPERESVVTDRPPLLESAPQTAQATPEGGEATGSGAAGSASATTGDEDRDAQASVGVPSSEPATDTTGDQGEPADQYAQAQQELPRSASDVPLLAVLGIAALAGAATLAISRRRRA